MNFNSKLDCGLLLTYQILVIRFGALAICQFFFIFLFSVVLCTDLFYQGLAPNRRRAIYRAAAKALASLHSADVDTIGLGKYGRRDNYCKRQVCEFLKFTLC